MQCPGCNGGEVSTVSDELPSSRRMLRKVGSCFFLAGSRMKGGVYHPTLHLAGFGNVFHRGLKSGR